MKKIVCATLVLALAGTVAALAQAPEMSQELAQADAALKHAKVDVDRARADVRRSEAQESIRRVSFDRLSAAIATDDANAGPS